MSLPLELIAVLLYVRSLRVSPLSLTVPYLSFTPAFLLITSQLMLGERPSMNGIIGIFIIVLGVYSLNLSDGKSGFFYPFRMLLREKGSIMMLMVALIYSITANFGKMGVLYSSSTFFAASYFTLLSIILSFLVIKRGTVKLLFRRELFLIGVLSAIMITFHLMAIKLVYVSYMIAIKRSSLLLGIVFGVVFFKEKGLKEKLIGGILMVIGILVITFFG